MKRFIVSALLISISYLSFAQDIDYLWEAYYSGKYEYVIEEAIPLIEQYPNNFELKLIVGRNFTDYNQFADAIPYLEDATTSSTRWIKAWALAFLGKCYYAIGENEKSQESFDTCIKMNATDNATSAAQMWKAALGFDNEYQNFESFDKTNIIFHIHRDALLKINDVESYMQERIYAFDSISGFFNVKLPTKINYYFWESDNKAYEVLQRHLGFANPGMCVIQSHYKQSIGHELTHIITHYIGKISYKTRIINEGIAVYFDMSGRNKLNTAKDMVKQYNHNVDIKSMWNDKEMDESLFYSIAGAFIEYLITSKGKDKFCEFFTDQSLDNAYKVYGNELDTIIEDFEEKFPETTSISLNPKPEMSALQRNISVFPNPCVQKFTIKTKSHIEINTINITDLSGKLIYINENKNNSYDIDLKAFANGTYFMKLITDKGIVFKKIIKQY